jgi:hypothetical protein
MLHGRMCDIILKIENMECGIIVYVNVTWKNVRYNPKKIENMKCGIIVYVNMIENFKLWSGRQIFM